MALEFPLTPNPSPKSDAEIAAIHANPGFGTHFSDHMSVTTWHQDQGWVADGVVPYGPFQINPACAVLHYAQEIFEGLKAYRHADGSIWLFRPDENAKRMNKSAERLVLPQLDEADFIKACTRLVETDARWVPDAAGERSLYLRPFMFASEDYVGVRPSPSAVFCVIGSPVAPYFAGGVKPVDIWVTADYARAGIGGTGFAKCGGNYAASLLPQVEGSEHGCSQVLYIESVGKDQVEELGGMNVFLYRDGKLLTPALDGMILDGITRKSVIQVAADLGIETEERRLTAADLFDGIASGAVQEAFACGTAAVMSPVNSFKSRHGVWQLPQPAGPVTLKLRERLIDIQYGRAEDTHGWMLRVV
ncbi:MAG: branched-chain amino acid aminotransferase [Propionibacteriaceae bacterium]|jgi:branched-chain amino acid aminotransferase|nr:branched-chain amino acid aminotransferase [Propionibacteriaceae bacterium]